VFLVEIFLLRQRFFSSNKVGKRKNVEKSLQLDLNEVVKRFYTAVFLCGQVQRNEDGEMTLKLADFGLAMEVVKPIFMVCGTPTYVAPEILTHTGQQ